MKDADAIASYTASLQKDGFNGCIERCKIMGRHNKMLSKFIPLGRVSWTQEPMQGRLKLTMCKREYIL